MEANELKPCPFCGKTDKLEFQSWVEQIEAGDDCYSQLVEVVFCNNHTVSAHIDIWQARPIEDALRAEVARLQSLLAAYDGIGEALKESTTTIKRLTDEHESDRRTIEALREKLAQTKEETK